MRRLQVILVAMSVLALAGTSDAAKKSAKTPPKIKALLITGDDVSAHNWREISEATRKDLVDSGRFDVKVCEDPLILESSSALKAYDVIVFTIYAAKTPVISAQAQENLLGFVKEGKGFCVQHLASASFPKWTEFANLCGRHWVMGTSGHGPRSVFDAKVVDKEHPITAGMEDFKANDELYSKLQGDAPIHVLVEAYSDWSKKTEPLVFTLEYGKGRVVHNAFGHDGKALENPCVAKIIARAAEWAAKGKVAQ
jgi:type 1 glutamine amidotransferase